MKKKYLLIIVSIITNFSIAAGIIQTGEETSITKTEETSNKDSVSGSQNNFEDTDYTGTELRLDFADGIKAPGTGNKLYAVWIENSEENFIQNLFVCKRVNLQNLAGPALPFWQLNKRPISNTTEVDAVTGATPLNDTTISKTLNANISNFKIYFEVDHSWDGNDWFTDQPAILYAADIDLTQPDTTYELQFVGWTWNGRSGILRSTTPSVVSGEFQDETRYITHKRNTSTGDFAEEDLLSRMATYMVESINLSIELIFPVELTSFSANVSGSNVELNWNTATEVNNYGFAVERSMVKGEWLEVGFIEGAGNSNSPKEYSFTDNLTLTPNLTLSYRLKQIDLDGSFTYSNEVKVNSGERATEFKLEQNYPNPFNPSTMISYSLPAGRQELPMNSNVSLKIFDVLGREVTTLVNEQKPAGTYNVEWDGTNSAGQQVGGGIYFYQLKTSNGFMETKKMLLIK